MPAAAVESLLVFPPLEAHGAAHMALDEAMMRLAREGRAALRFYAWEPPCLSLGRNQPTEGRVAGRPREAFTPGVDIVRRPTAGRSVYHGPELTYAIVTPERTWGGPKAIYAAIHAALEEALAAVGVTTDDRPGHLTGRPAGSLPLDARACFVAPAPGEITVGGRKLVGSAQWRHRGAVLQHGSILVRDEQDRAELEVVSGVATGSALAGEGSGDAISDSGPSKPGRPRAIGLADVLGRAPDLETFRRTAAGALGQALGVLPTRYDVPRDISRVAGRLEVGYRSREWTWRR